MACPPCTALHVHAALISHLSTTASHTMNRRIFAVMIFALSGIASLTEQSTLQAQQQIRAGMIGLDTSHVPAFTRIFNNSKDNADLAGIKIVVGYPGGTDIDSSKNRIEKFTNDVRGMGLEIVD